MEKITMNVKYGGTSIDIQLFPGEDVRGIIYPVEINGNYFFTLSYSEDEEWNIMREANGITPQIDHELFEVIIKKLEYQLRYAA